ncbi:MAG TPA: phage baseplate assembly protein V [Aliidongia sp.]|nr:phage baseplate assembly protein V [Aliidongia sp.]
MINTIAKLTAPLVRRVMLMIGRGGVSAIDDTTALQTVQINGLPGEVASLPRYQEYGRTAVPQPGAQSVQAYIGGLRGNGMVIVIDDPRVRPTGLKPGELMDYTDEGPILHHQRGRLTLMTVDTLVIQATTKIRFETPLLEVTGDITDHADDGSGETMAAQRSVFNGHAHLVVDVQGGEATINTNKPSQQE